MDADVVPTVELAVDSSYKDQVGKEPPAGSFTCVSNTVVVYWMG